MAVAKKSEPPAPSEPPVAEAQPVVIAPVKRNPRAEIGVDTGVHGVYAYEPIPDGEWLYDRRITLRGQNYEHTATDPDGVWIYRSM